MSLLRPRRAPRPALARAPFYRVAVPVIVVALGLITLALMLLAGGVLLGIVPYPGR